MAVVTERPADWTKEPVKAINNYCCPKCNIYASHEVDIVYIDPESQYKYKDSISDTTGDGWTEEVECHQCGTVYIFINGSL